MPANNRDDHQRHQRHYRARRYPHTAAGVVRSDSMTTWLPWLRPPRQPRRSAAEGIWWSRWQDLLRQAAVALSRWIDETAIGLAAYRRSGSGRYRGPARIEVADHKGV